MNTKQSQLGAIAKDIRRCLICKIGTSGKAVPGEGNPNATFMFIGEAPGKKEAKTGRPFVGRSGQYLRSLIRLTGLSENDVYITSPVKYLPDKGTPTQKQIAHGKTHLAQQIEIIQPKLLVLLGSVACKSVLGHPHKVLKEHGSVLRHHGKAFMITLHPAAVLRFPKYKPIIEQDFLSLRSF